MAEIKTLCFSNIYFVMFTFKKLAKKLFRKKALLMKPNYLFLITLNADFVISILQSFSPFDKSVDTELLLDICQGRFKALAKESPSIKPLLDKHRFKTTNKK